MAGSYLFAEVSEPLSRTVQNWGEKGKLMLPDVLHAPRGVVIVGVVLLIVGVLTAVERLGGR